MELGNTALDVYITGYLLVLQALLQFIWKERTEITVTTPISDSLCRGFVTNSEADMKND